MPRTRSLALESPSDVVPRHDHPRARAAQSRIPVQFALQLDHPDGAVLRAQPFRRAENRLARLEASGRAERSIGRWHLSLADLKNMPTVTKPLTIECAGNGRVYLSPKVRGVAWQLGAVGNAEWTGVALADVLYSDGSQIVGRRNRARRGRHRHSQRRSEIAGTDRTSPQPADREGEEARGAACLRR